MCNPASMVVTRGGTVFWSASSDSHTDIITEHGLREIDARGDINIVPVEITPLGGDMRIPLRRWNFSVDMGGIGREVPTWFDADKAERNVRLALKDWYKTKCVMTHVGALCDRGAQYYIYGSVDVLNQCNCNTEVRAGGAVVTVGAEASIALMSGNVKSLHGRIDILYGTVADVCSNACVDTVASSGKIDCLGVGGRVNHMHGFIGVACEGSDIGEVSGGKIVYVAGNIYSVKSGTVQELDSSGHISRVDFGSKVHRAAGHIDRMSGAVGTLAGDGSIGCLWEGTVRNVSGCVCDAIGDALVTSILKGGCVTTRTMFMLERCELKHPTAVLIDRSVPSEVTIRTGERVCSKRPGRTGRSREK